MRRLVDFLACCAMVVTLFWAFEVVFFEITIGPERLNMAQILWSCVTRIG